uniref:BACK domain-containing protein n=1 Tax=Plectus sambesii TaxID=2011161 RepID=A0A914W6K0_9BILA
MQTSSGWRRFANESSDSEDVQFLDESLVNRAPNVAYAGESNCLDAQRPFVQCIRLYEVIVCPPDRNRSAGKSCAATDSLKTVVYIDEFEADVFKQLLEYIHTGSTVLDASTVVGLMNAADHFSLNDLRRACFDFANSCIRCDTVCALLTAAEKYIQYKSTKVLMQKVLEFIDRRAEQILALGDFVHLPEHIVQLIISRDDLNASELTKYRAVERWTLNAVQSSSFSSSSSSGQPLCQLTLLRRFAQHIAFHEIPASVLMAEIRPLQIVPDAELMAALAFQADPTSLPPKEGFARTPKSQRRLTVCFSPITFDNRSLSTATALAEEEGESAGSDHGSSGYESLGSGGSCIIAKDGKTLVHIDSIVTEIHPKSKSVTDLSFVPIDYKV